MSAATPAQPSRPTSPTPFARLAATSRPERVRIAIVVASALIAGVVAVALLATSPYRDSNDDQAWLIQAAANLFTIGVGLLAWHLRPSNRVGPLMVVAGFASLIDFLSLSGDSLAWTVGSMWNLLGFVVLANVYLAFPDGRTRGWSRRLTVAIYAWFLVFSLASRLLDVYPAEWAIHNPLLVWPNEDLSATLSTIANVGALVLAILVVGTVLDRWRRGSAVARRALAPVFWVSPITLVVVGTYFVGRAIDSDALLAVSTGPLAQLSNFLLPLAFLVGLLQTRLERGSIADLVRDLDCVATGDLEAALARAIHDPTLQLAFATADGSGYVDPAGRLVTLPSDDAARSVSRVVGADSTIAVLIHDPAVDPELVDSAVAASRLALENERLTAELRAQLEEVRASRERIVAATDEERRRLERDLHDGAQQRLVALGFTLRRASRQADADPELARVLDEANRELEDGLRELRALARGIHPTALTEAGLAPAVRELADRFPLPVEVDLPAQRVSPAIESTAYFIVNEALTNVMRHAQATRVTILGQLTVGALRLEITDDGRGGAGDPAIGSQSGADGQAGGSGVRGLVDRAQAVGGTVSMESQADAGTTIRAWLPLA